MASTVKRAEIRWPDLDTVYSVNPDGSRNFLHPADVSGRWQRRKTIIFAILIAIYASLPWIQVGGNPAMLLDLPAREAFLFGRSFTNQDFYLVFFLVTGMGFGLFVLTSLWGRIWCGYACPQTVFLEGVFRKVERWIEGSRNVRLRRNKGPWSLDKLWRKTLKQAIFVVLSAVIAHIFLSYFIPVRELREVLTSSPARHWTAFFWTVFWTAVLYFNYSWFREQTCLIVCPYGRLQSALIDSDTIVVGYDTQRGEPRSKLSDDAGDCVDCRRCVVVCPTGIDIRNGLQMECVGCANCIDACDEVMRKIERPEGLIRYDSRSGFETGRRRRLLRPRVAVYTVLAMTGLIVFGAAAGKRESFEVKLLRAKGLPFSLEGDRIRNLYTLSIQNKTQEDQVYLIEARDREAGDDEETEFIIAQSRVRVRALSIVQVPVFAFISRSEYDNPYPLTFTVVDSASGTARNLEALFRGP